MVWTYYVVIKIALRKNQISCTNLWAHVLDRTKIWSTANLVFFSLFFKSFRLENMSFFFTMRVLYGYDQVAMNVGLETLEPRPNSREQVK